MGISGLLENLKSIVRKRNAKDFNGLKVAVDGHCWLHRGAHSCSKDITNGVSTAKYVQIFISMVNVLRNSGISHILVVFDGLPLPNKIEVNQKRSESKKQNIELAKAAEIAGDHKLAMTYYQRSVSVTFDMVKNVMSALDQLGVAYMMAPYESDAQLAWLSKHKIVDVVVTEDSDTIAYGCQQVFLKMDRDGNGELIQSADIPLNQTLSFTNWTDDQFILFCCLAGCDYMPGLVNFGVKSAHKAVAKHKTLSRVVDSLTLSGALREYSGPFVSRLQQAVMTFKHQTIYNPFTETTEPLTPLPEHHSGVGVPSAAIGVDGAVSGSVQRRSATSALQRSRAEYAFLGPLLDADTAKQLAAGKLNPRTLLANSTAPVYEQAEQTSAHRQPASGPADLDNSAYRPPARTTATSNSADIDWEFKFPQRNAADDAGNPQQAQRTEPSIRWRSAEDHSDLLLAAHGSHQSATVHAPPVRTRGRPKNSALTTTGTVVASVPTSAAAASFVTQQYRSSLVSDDLQAMHRQARPRNLEPNYRKHRRTDGHSVDRHEPIPLRSEEFDGEVFPAANAEFVGATARVPTVYPAHTPPEPLQATSKKRRFFDTPPPSSPPIDFVSDELASELQQDIAADANNWDAPLVDSETSYLDNVCGDSADVLPAAAEVSPQRGLSQFQDDVFFASADAAHKLALLRPLSADLLHSAGAAVPRPVSTNLLSRFDQHPSAYMSDPQGWRNGPETVPIHTVCPGESAGRSHFPCTLVAPSLVQRAAWPNAPCRYLTDERIVTSPWYGSLGHSVAARENPRVPSLYYAPSAALWNQPFVAAPAPPRSAVSEVAHFLREADTYDVHRKHALFPSLGGIGAASYDLY